ncbi:MAG: hypothetical protein CMO80_15190 [Verrucomicrobiales bacterium]|nr:hypothetical protein [Verrucomicrobiales bacterium]|tara:strand:+ start:1528 stop:1815 length:288 start_codon:yes stop_codon:yes gene_type:complete
MAGYRFKHHQETPDEPPLCKSNLMLIDAAVMKWAMASGQAKTNSYSLDDNEIVEHIKGGSLPVCPDGATYKPGATIWDLPSRTVGGHAHKLLPGE